MYKATAFGGKYIDASYDITQENVSQKVVEEPTLLIMFDGETIMTKVDICD